MNGMDGLSFLFFFQFVLFCFFPSVHVELIWIDSITNCTNIVVLITNSTWSHTYRRAHETRPLCISPSLVSAMFKSNKGKLSIVVLMKRDRRRGRAIGRDGKKKYKIQLIKSRDLLSSSTGKWTHYQLGYPIMSIEFIFCVRAIHSVPTAASSFQANCKQNRRQIIMFVYDEISCAFNLWMNLVRQSHRPHHAYIRHFTRNRTL